MRGVRGVRGRSGAAVGAIDSSSLRRAEQGRRYRHWPKQTILLASVGDVTAVMSQLFGEIGGRAFFRLRLVRHAGVVDAGRHHRNVDDAFQAVVEGGADDDVGVLVRLLSNASGGFLDLE